jgi:hypothetical protein
MLPAAAGWESQPFVGQRRNLLTLSTTQAGRSEPSTSTVIRITAW